MGKDEDDSVNQSNDEDTVSSEEKTDKVSKNDEEAEEPKKNADNLRKVIKINPSEEQEKNESEPEQNDQISEDEELSKREALEQKRAILQSIKDFDFHIKKNQEDISSINNKLDGVLKDLDDLVSLYEVVSEQMNPFVGLSKVTKKRIDALENFTKEIDDIKDRIGDIESFAERTGSDFAEIKALRKAEKDENKLDLNSTLGDLSGDDLDIIIEKSIREISIDRKIDTAIDDFIETLKDWNMN
jgi:flagellar protein FlaC